MKVKIFGHCPDDNEWDICLDDYSEDAVCKAYSKEYAEEIVKRVNTYALQENKLDDMGDLLRVKDEKIEELQVQNRELATDIKTIVDRLKYRSEYGAFNKYDQHSLDILENVLKRLEVVE